MFKLSSVVASAAGLIAFGTAAAADLSGAGATFPAPIYAKWAETYRAQTGTGQTSAPRTSP
jgi:phosphate transport system substrate-binding protein